jgi:hypothetical protein
MFSSGLESRYGGGFVGKALFRQARYLLIDIGLVLRKAFLVS